MGSLRRVWNVILALAMLAGAAVLMLDPRGGIVYVALAIGAGLLVYGLRMIWYWFSMARHMVGGLTMLFIGVIALDAGGFACALAGGSRLPIVLYLVALNALSGVFGIVRALEARRLEGHWRLRLTQAVVSLLIVVACIAFFRSDRVIVTIFSAGLVASAAVRITEAFRTTEVIYIQ